jgi:hypothetical protein
MGTYLTATYPGITVIVACLHIISFIRSNHLYTQNYQP